MYVCNGCVNSYDQSQVKEYLRKIIISNLKSLTTITLIISADKTMIQRLKKWHLDGNFILSQGYKLMD